MSVDVDLISLRFGRLRGAMPPLGPLSLLAALQSHGITCRLTDTQFDPQMHPFAVDILASWITTSDAPIIAFSVFNDAVPLVVATLDRLAGHLRGRRLFIGGPGVVGIARQLLERVPALETVIVGEGETAFPLAIKDPRRAAALPGVFTRGGGGSVSGAGRTAREDLDRLLAIDWRLVAGRRYSTVPWSTMRGCPFSCEFCEIIAFMGRMVTTRNILRAMEDLERAIDALGTKRIAILDDTFTVSRQRVLDICGQLSRRNLGISFEIFSRTDTIDVEMMQALAEAGCVRVLLGVDAGDDGMLKLVSKGITAEKAERTLHTAAQFFEVTASFIWGYPFESMDSFRRTLLLAQRLRTHRARFAIWPQLHLVSPSAGTPLFDKFCRTLLLDVHTETLPLGGCLSTQSFRSDFSTVLDVISAEPLLAAPFYRYATPNYEEKCADVEEFNRSLDKDVGDVVIQELMKMENLCTS